MIIWYSDVYGNCLVRSSCDSSWVYCSLFLLNLLTKINIFCFLFIQLNSSLVDWSWTSEGCFVRPPVDYDEKAICECHHVGVFAITTHMYDVNVSIYTQHNSHLNL